MTEDIHIEVKRESIQSIIQAHVQTAVMDALLPHKEQFVQAIVEESLLQKSKDKSYQYKHDEETPTVLEHMVRTIIAEEAAKGIKEWAESHREEIAEKIRQAMMTKKYGRAIATQIATQMAEANEYRFSIQVTPIARD